MTTTRTYPRKIDNGYGSPRPIVLDIFQATEAIDAFRESLPPTVMSEHVDYPHQPGMLYDCRACEDGPCVCDETSAGCVSADCIHRDDDGHLH